MSKAKAKPGSREPAPESKRGFTRRERRQHIKTITEPRRQPETEQDVRGKDDG